MASRIVAFPVKGRRWAFSVARAAPATSAGTTSKEASFMQAWRLAREYRLSGKTVIESFTPITQYVSNKMESQWIELGLAKEGSIRNRLHRMGEKLLSKMEPSEMFLKSIPTGTTSLEIIFPLGLNPRLVRRRARHIGKSGAQIHSWYILSLFQMHLCSGICSVHMRIGKLFRKLLEFVGDGFSPIQSNASVKEETISVKACPHALVLSPCKKLKHMLQRDKAQIAAVSDTCIARICELYHLDYSKTLKWRDLEDKKMKTAT